MWQSEEERDKDAETIVSAVEDFHRGKAELDAHLAAGRSHESYMIGKIEAGATSFGMNNVTNYAAGIDKALDEANRQMCDCDSTATGASARIPTLTVSWPNSIMRGHSTSTRQ